jgi:hypothetical protein
MADLVESDLGRRMHALMMRCWIHDPEKRPTFKEIAQQLIKQLADDEAQADEDGDLEEM